jgi:ribosomal protein S18 acetylase RimI-like enzyme
MGTPGTIIRPAELSDLDVLQAVIQRAYRGRSAAASWSHEGELPEGERVSRGDLEALLGATDARLSVAEIAGQIVGSSLVVAVVPGECEIRLVSVDPSVQGEGLGGQLLGHAEALAGEIFAASHATIEVLQHKSRLIAYYERRGYRRTEGSRPYPHPLKVPARFLKFRKDLRP